MRRRQKIMRLISVLCASLMLSSCVGNSIPISDESYALPEVESSYAAPIGDASLDYEDTVVFYLPLHDGSRLTTVTETVTLSESRLIEESIVRLLLEENGNSIASPLGGDVKLSLYGANPVEVSGDVATVNLAATALQLDREDLFLVSQAITNTLTELSTIQYVNVLVMDKQIGLDLAATLPMGTLSRSMGEDIDALYEQLMSHRVLANETPSEKSLTTTATLYFPLSEINGVMSEARNITFDSMDPADMAVTLLEEISEGASTVEGSPVMPLLVEYLTEDPTVTTPNDAGGSVVTLKFDYLFDEMLRVVGVSRASCLAALCYTMTTFIPNVVGIEVYIDSELVEHVMLGSTSGILFDDGIQERADYAALLMDNCTLYFADSSYQKLVEVNRPIVFYQTSSPRVLLTELFKGSQASDDIQNVQATVGEEILKDSDIIGISLDGDAILVNFSENFLEVGQEISENQDRLMVYSIVNTLLHSTNAKRVALFVGGEEPEGFTDEISWSGWFLENLGIVSD